MKRVLLPILMSLITLYAAALPARRDARIVYQPDSTALVVFAHGDEHFSWLTNADGEWVEQDENGYYRVVEALSESRIQQLRRNSPYAEEQVQTAIKLNIAPRGLVIMAQFQDVGFSVSKATMDTMLNGNNFTRQYDYTYNNKSYHVESSGSARQYFEQSSFGQYSPRFDLIGPVTVSRNSAYYGSDNGGRDAKVQELIKEACEKAASAGADFSLYDNDNDGNVDFVYVIYAGYGQADGGPAETIWPHKSKLSKYTVRLNGKRVYNYACGNEMNFYSKRFFGIGQFCHEFGHVLGLPDIYATGNQKTLGMWDIMDYGPYNNDGNTPPAYSGYERFFCGWAEPRQLIEPENVTLNSLAATNEVLIITESGMHNLIGNDPYPLTFYTLENRQGEWWFSSCPGKGMIITKISYNYANWYSNVVNNSASSMGIDIMEADGVVADYPNVIWYGKASDAFPQGASEYKAINNNAITEIKMSDAVISFKYRGGSISSLDSNTYTEQQTTTKLLIDGQVCVRRNGLIYDILGNIIHKEHLE